MDAIQITILSIVIMIALGYVLKRIGFLSVDNVDTLNNIVINIMLPSMIFSALYTADLSMMSSLGILPFVILASSFVTGIISYFLLKSFNISDKMLWSVLITIMIANTGFMGYPISIGVYGNEGFLRAIFCDIATSVIFLILSFALVLKFGGSPKTAVKKIAFFPPLWAIILGILLNITHISIGPVLENTVNYLGNGTIPLIMLSLGISIDFGGIKRSKNMIIFTSIMKLMIFPLIAFFIVSQLGLSGLQFKVPIIEAAMPSGMLSLVLAITYKLDSELTSDCILINTVISLITLPVILMLL